MDVKKTNQGLQSLLDSNKKIEVKDLNIFLKDPEQLNQEQENINQIIEKRGELYNSLIIAQIRLDKNKQILSNESLDGDKKEQISNQIQRDTQVKNNREEDLANIAKYIDNIHKNLSKKDELIQEIINKQKLTNDITDIAQSIFEQNRKQLNTITDLQKNTQLIQTTKHQKERDLERRTLDMQKNLKSVINPTIATRTNNVKRNKELKRNI
ncbi:MAG: hypothetical protein AB8B67_04250 [Rickettsiaceae bacterium]